MPSGKLRRHGSEVMFLFAELVFSDKLGKECLESDPQFVVNGPDWLFRQTRQTILRETVPVWRKEYFRQTVKVDNQETSRVERKRHPFPFNWNYQFRNHEYSLSEKNRTWFLRRTRKWRLHETNGTPRLSENVFSDCLNCKELGSVIEFVGKVYTGCFRQT